MNERLTFEELQYVQNEIKIKGKNLFLSYILLVLFSFIGVHYAYLERVKSAILRVVLTIVTIGALYPIIGLTTKLQLEGVTRELQQQSSFVFAMNLILIFLNVLWSIYDIVLLPKMVRIANEKTEQKAMNRIYISRNVESAILETALASKMVEEISSKVDLSVSKKLEESKEEIEKTQERINNLNRKNAETVRQANEKSAELESILSALLRRAEDIPEK